METIYDSELLQKYVGKYWADIEAEVHSLSKIGVCVMEYGLFGTTEYREGRITVWLNKDETVRSIGYN